MDIRPNKFKQIFIHILILSQVYAALTYYYDHQAEIDALVRDEEQEYQAAWQQQQQDPKHQAFVAGLRLRREQK